jgi:WhiB family redox-sensing transcriptional regulator
MANKSPRTPTANGSLAWRSAAACRAQDLYLFFGGEKERLPAKTSREEEAKRVCVSCRVRAECLGYAFVNNEATGVWAGLGEDERAAKRRSWVKARARLRAAAEVAS